MSGSTRQPGRSDRCRAFRGEFQPYLDGDLARERSLAVFLHVRECAGCRRALEDLKALVSGLSSLPAFEPPPGFDEAVLRAVPYAHYREMATLRAPRLPVYLEESFLPAALRSVAARTAGVTVAGGALAALFSGWLPEAGAVIVGLGLAPEALVRLQRLARRARLATRRSESG